MRQIIEIKAAVGAKKDGFVLRWSGKLNTFLAADWSGFISDLDRAKVFPTFRAAHEARKTEEAVGRTLDIVAVMESLA